MNLGNCSDVYNSVMVSLSFFFFQSSLMLGNYILNTKDMNFTDQPVGRLKKLTSCVRNSSKVKLLFCIYIV